jgi:putative DNA primase/helicase
MAQQNVKAKKIMNDFIDEFRDFASSLGIILPDFIVGDGLIRNIYSPQRKKTGVYKLHLDERPAGFVQCHKLGIKENWKSSNHRKYTEQERNKFRESVEISRAKAQKARDMAYGEAANRAVDIWNLCLPVNSHAYLGRKKIQPHGAKDSKGLLVIPVYQLNGNVINIVSLQYIYRDGSKKFLAGGKKLGCFFPIGKKSNVIRICEGFATGSSIFEHLGGQVIVAFDAGNLLPVAKVVRLASPLSKIIMMADNDISQVGQLAAKKAADEVGGNVEICPVEGFDFNDYFTSDEYMKCL